MPGVPLSGIIIAPWMAKNVTSVISRGAMKRFYYQTWLPFVVTKRRILVLAIASYLALC